MNLLSMNLLTFGTMFYACNIQRCDYSGFSGVCNLLLGDWRFE